MSPHNPYEGWNSSTSGWQRPDAASGSHAPSGSAPYAGNPYAGASRSQPGNSGASPYASAYGYDGAGASRSHRPDEAKGSVSAQDFERMCRSVVQSASEVAKVVGKGIGEAGDALGQAVDAYQQAYRQTRQQTNRQTKAMTDPKAARRQRLAAIRSRFRSSAGLTASGTALSAFGGVLTLSFACAFAISLIGFVHGGAPYAVVAAGFSALFGGLSAWMLTSGVRRLQTSSRFKSFQRVFGNREVCNISELSSQLNMSEGKVLSSARRMLKYGLLPQGHIDDESTCLMVTDNAYHMYRQLQGARRQQLMEAQQAQQAQQAARVRNEESHSSEQLPQEAKTFIGQGSDYVAKLRELDEAIDDAAVSAKIVAIVEVVERILRRAHDEPSVVGGMVRLTDYYLPLTVKLLEAYDDLEEQPVQGSTIAGSRKEIEQALDALRSAFEKLLDESFQDLSFDVSSDISVLNAMLAREGLTDSPFDQGKR